MKNLFVLLFAPFFLSSGKTDSTNYILIRHLGNSYYPVPQIIINKEDFVAPGCGEFYVYCYSINGKNFDDIRNFIKTIKNDSTLDVSGNILFTIHYSKTDSSQYILNYAHSKIFLHEFIIFLKDEDPGKGIFMGVDDLMSLLDM